MAGMTSKDLGALGEASTPVVGAAGVGQRGAGSVVSAKSSVVREAAGGGVALEGVTRAAVDVAKRVGRGRVPQDSRKFKYDRLEATRKVPVKFGASRVDRMDPEEAGGYLHRIHQMLALDRENESVIAAFDKALFLEHALNGASLLQPNRGKIYIGDGDNRSEFELFPIKQLLGVEQRRFFRAYADEVAMVLREVLASYDAWDHVSNELCGQINQLAIERNLQKYPYLVHDSADACTFMSGEERLAVMASKKVVLETTRNKVDVVNYGVDDREVPQR